jgi:plasmid stabilization system protein ParE
MSKTVTVHRRATADLVNIAGSIARSVSPDSARRWRNQVDGVIRSLADDADTWPEADETGTLNLDLRCRLFGKRRHVYRILFTIDGQAVSVLRVRHAAQDSVTEVDL